MKGRTARRRRRTTRHATRVGQLARWRSEGRANFSPRSAIPIYQVGTWATTPTAEFGTATPYSGRIPAEAISARAVARMSPRCSGGGRRPLIRQTAARISARSSARRPDLARSLGLGYAIGCRDASQETPSVFEWEVSSEVRCADPQRRRMALTSKGSPPVFEPTSRSPRSHERRRD